MNGIQVASNQILSLMRAFMDGITIKLRGKAQVEASIDKLHELISGCAMRFNPSKNWSLSLCKGKLVPNTNRANFQACRAAFQVLRKMV